MQTLHPFLIEEQRKLFHAAFNDWISQATEVEFDQLATLREQLRPGEICSMLSLVRSCFARSELLAGLPTTLVQLLRERNWLRPYVASTVPEAAAARH